MKPPGSRPAGAIVRSARQALGLTLADLGQRTGYSVSQISRYERGIAPMTDTKVLRRFAGALGLPPQAFGLLPDMGGGNGQPTVMINMRAMTDHARAPSVVKKPTLEDGEEVRRRDLLTGAAGLAAGALGLPGSARAANLDPSGGLADLLYGHRPLTATPLPLPALRAAADQAQMLFQGARYDRLASQLPRLIATATLTRNHADGQDRQAADTLLAEAYLVASAFAVKLNDDQLAWTTADRAAQTAAASGDALTLADAQRSLATVMRRTGRPDRARALLIGAADSLAPGRTATAEQLSMYGTLLEVAAYTAAVDGDRSEAADLIAAAQAAAMRLGHDTLDQRHTFGPTAVALYQVSIAQVLGDNGAAIAYAKTVDPAAIPTPERRGRYWIDVARAWHQWGKTEACYRALLAAERAAPAEVRFRPPVRRMTHDLLRAPRQAAMPGLRAFAGRIGVSV